MLQLDDSGKLKMCATHESMQVVLRCTFTAQQPVSDGLYHTQCNLL
jgi:hypothetical protein